MKRCDLRVNPRGRSASAKAKAFIARHVEHHIRDLGMEPTAAVASAYEEARRAGYSVPRANPSVTRATRKKRRARRRARERANVLSLSSRHRRKRTRRARRSLTNPVIGDSALALTYHGGQGKRKGKMRGPWRHQFEADDVQVRGRKDGSLVLRSKSGKRLWDFFEV